MCILCKFNFALIFLFFREFNLSAKVILLETLFNKLSPVLSNLKGEDDSVKVVKNKWSWRQPRFRKVSPDLAKTWGEDTGDWRHSTGNGADET